VTRSAAGLSPGGSELPTSVNPGPDGSGLPSASIVIPTRSRPELLKCCLDGVARQDVKPLEVLVVDNTQGEEATRQIALAGGARYVVEPTPGLSCARNRGARESAGEIVAFLDDDAVPERNWLAALLPEFLDPLVGAVAGRILASKPGPVSDRSAANAVTFGGSQRLVFDRGLRDWVERANFGGVGEGPNLAIRRSVFGTWPGFDERLGRGTRFGVIGMEEHYAFFSLIDQGHRVVYTPAAQVRHRFPQTEAELRARHLRQLTAASFHLTLLLVEEPRYRRRAARYALEALRATSRTWRREMGIPVSAIPSWERVPAQFAGVALYMFFRLSCPKRVRARMRARSRS
jgi:cellulose synthase/poly-beta-1,6-N-acetylglucosamine synthase-like glycosyltransferase